MTWARVKQCLILAIGFGLGHFTVIDSLPESTFQSILSEVFFGLAAVLFILGVFAPIGITFVDRFVFGNSSEAGEPDKLYNFFLLEG